MKYSHWFKWFIVQIFIIYGRVTMQGSRYGVQERNKMCYCFQIRFITALYHLIRQHTNTNYGIALQIPTMPVYSIQVHSTHTCQNLHLRLCVFCVFERHFPVYLRLVHIKILPSDHRYRSPSRSKEQVIAGAP